MGDNTIRSAQRIFSLLELLADKGPLGVTELSIAAVLNKTTVFRQLNTLVTLGYVKKDEQTEKYYLSFKLLEVAGNLLKHIDMRNMARPFLEELAAQSEETVHLVQKDGAYITYIDKVEPTINSVRMVSRVGMRQPLYCTAVGKALLAELSDREIRIIWDNSIINRLTPNTIVDWKCFINEIDKVRKAGYAQDNEENELGVRCVAVALRDYTGQSQHAISISAPISRLSDEKLESLAEKLMKIKSEFTNL
ncbi:MAG: IclR family transcriptional regulator [Oscillospiraceae bacterium]|nr:IclR family transcriptional regulator [Oscillospiraceae bacterium]MDD3832368.1 IclR family transcriptional regulator [Oscillospiraceae bacterium]MDD4546162.1 IclR family transcriptional regulator [Oscillospiraceae bacterium]